jgi:hypothetical protein
MKRFYQGLGGMLIGALLLLPSAGRAQTDEPPVVDPDAMAALKKMGEYLRTLNTFQVSGYVTTEQVLDDSQKIMVTKDVSLIASRPNKLRVQIKSYDFDRVMLYDGSTFTLWAPNKKFYATETAPPNINELAKLLEDKHGIELPLVDLFRWGTPESRMPEITSAKDVGPDVCDGITCEQYAFRQPGLDWQIWIQRGDYPLPRRIVITTTTDEARPQHQAIYKWNLAPSFNQESFAFVPPADAKKIPLADLRQPKVATESKD